MRLISVVLALSTAVMLLAICAAMREAPVVLGWDAGPSAEIAQSCSTSEPPTGNGERAEHGDDPSEDLAPSSGSAVSAGIPLSEIRLHVPPQLRALVPEPNPPPPRCPRDFS